MDNSSLLHSKLNCRYHRVFASKYRRQIICGKIKKDIGAIPRKLSEQKSVDMLIDSFESKDTTLIRQAEIKSH